MAWLPRLRGVAPLFAGVWLAYFAGGQIAFEWFGADASPVFFPAAGVTLGALVLTPTRRWPVVLAAAFTAELAVDLSRGGGVVIALGWALANTAEPLLGAGALRRVGGGPHLERRADLARFLVLPVVAAPAVGAAIAATNAKLHDSATQWDVFAGRWWLGDGLGVLVVGGGVLVFAATRTGWPRIRRTEGVLLVGAAIVASWFVFLDNDLRWAYIPVASMSLIAIRLGTRAVACAGVGIAFVTAQALQADPEFWRMVGLEPRPGLVYLQLTLALLIATAFAVAAEVGAREEAMRDALRNEARLHQEEQARGRAETLAAVLAELEAVDEFSARAERLVGMLVSRIADFATLEAPGAEDVLVASSHRDPERQAVLDALRRRHPRPAQGFVDLRADYAGDAEAEALVGVLGPTSCLAVPLPAAGLVLLLGLSEPGRAPYHADDLEFVEEIGTLAGVSLAAARTRDYERTIAVRLQQTLLPVAVVEHPRVVIAARYRPADDRLVVGGDWYETLLLPDDVVAVAVGDIVGKGLEAAAAMGQLRTVVGALAPIARSPADLLHRLDDFAETLDSARGSTACCALFNTADGTLRYASAGHLPILVVDRDGGARYLPGGRSWPLCTGVDRPRPEASATIAPGSTLLLYSDGLVERRRESIDVGLDRLSRAASRNAGRDAEALCDAVIAELTAGRRVEDDVVLLALRTVARKTPLNELSRPGGGSSLSVIGSDLPRL